MEDTISFLKTDMERVAYIEHPPTIYNASKPKHDVEVGDGIWILLIFASIMSFIKLKDNCPLKKM